MKIVAVVTLAVLSSIQAKHTEQFDVRVDVDKVVHRVDEKFLSTKFSADIFRTYWQKVNTSSKQLHSLAKGLKSGFLRIGGTAAQRVIFRADGDRERSRKKDFTLTGKQWEKMYNFVHNVGWTMIFNFNHLLRKGDEWDPTNAKEFLKYSEQKDFSICCFQLGNEPNTYESTYGVKYISPATLVKDMHILREVLSAFPKYKDSKIIGPDVTRLSEDSSLTYMKGFLEHGGGKVVSALTFHHYYISPYGVNVTVMYNTTVLNTMIENLRRANKLAEHDNLPVWITAASSLTRGGLKGASDRYVAGFMWLDKLGLSALYGVKTVIRQTFIGGGRYPLISNDLFPNPDYFLSVLYKRLVKGPIFKVITSTNEVRAYASCTNTDDHYEKGALTVYILNLKDDDVTVNFPDYAGEKYHLYLLEPGDSDGLTSKYVKLNGKKLLMKNEELPELPPSKTSHIVFPPKTFGFIVIPNAHVKAC